MERAIQDVSSYKTAVGAATFPGAQLKQAASLLNFLQETFKQLESKYMEHPFIADLIAKHKAEQEAKAKQNA